MIPDFFHLFAIVKIATKRHLERVPILRGLQESLARDWKCQLRDFVHEITEIRFNVGYTPGDSERFVLHDFDLPDWLVPVTESDAIEIHEIEEEGLDRISGMVAVSQDRNERRCLLFQNFTRSRVISPRALWWSQNAYTQTGRAGFSLSDSLSAVYYLDDRKLIFSKFPTVNSFLPLMDHYWVASDEQIREVLSNPLFAVDDIDTIAYRPTQWIARRFAILRESGVLNKVPIADVVQKAQDCRMEIPEQNGKLVFPSTRAEQKKVLQFLCEEIFRGALTATIYETNSKKPRD